MGAMVQKLSLLVVDDDPDMVRIVNKYLENEFSEEITVTSFVDSVEAKNWLDQNCCDILLSDIEMPELNGLDMLKFAKQRNAWTQVVFLTGASTWDLVAEAIESGASDYLLKPLKKTDLVNVISHLTERMYRWRAALRSSIRSSIKS